MKSAIEKLKADIDVLDERVKAKEAILKCVFANLEDTSKERHMIHKVFGVTPKVLFTTSHVSLKERWCFGFEDAVCVSLDVMNTSEQNHIQPICHTIESSGLVRTVVLDEEGAGIATIRPGSSAELLVGFSKSQFFDSSQCTLLLELIPHPSSEKSPVEDVLAHSIATRTRLPSETRSFNVAVPLKWYSFQDFVSAKEQEMLVLLRCLRVASCAHPLKPTSSLDFAGSNLNFYCCDFGDWQVFVGHGLMAGLVAASSSFNQPNGNIDRIYGINGEVLDAFARRYR